MNVIRQEIRYHFKSWLIWSLSLGIFVIIFSTEFSAYYNNPEFLDILEIFPDQLLEAFGLAGTNLTTLSGFMSYVLVYINLVGSVYAMTLGAAILSKEHKARTAEFLLVMPIKRTKIIREKIGAVLFLNVMLVLMVFVMMIMATLGYQPDGKYLALMGLSSIVMVVLLSFWSAVGMFLASVLARPKQASMIGVMLVFSAYLLSIFIPIVGSIDFLKVITPFAYFDTRKILSSLNLPWLKVSVLILLTGIFFQLTMYFYKKRNVVY